MALVTEMELPRLDYLAEDLRGERFHDVMNELRSRSWLAAAPIGYFVLDREAASFFLRTKSATFPGMKIAELFGVEEGPLLEQMRRNILHVNGDAHRRLRNLVNPAFTPRAADRWRPAMREFLGRLWEPLAGAAECEFVAAFAKPYPSLTIATVMGAPLDDAPRLYEWSNLIQRQFDGPSLLNERDAIERACAEFYDWAGELIERRRDDPGDDLISTLIAASHDGDRLSDVECMNLVLNVLVGGVDTTQAQLAQALRLFAAHPEQWELLAARPELAPRAVEETLRYEPITPFTARLLHKEVEYRGVTFPVDTVVMVAAFTGNRDGVEGDPDAFDITAERGEAKPLTFGAGIHYCLGASLARAELQEALGVLPTRMPGLDLAGAPEFGSIHGIYGLERLPLRWK
ncbi:MAG TPA: cytochrome P450 [Thermoleophilaceae bacterium]|jgi:cytochrome P450